MFRYLYKTVRFLHLLNNKNGNDNIERSNSSRLSNDLESNLNHITNILGDSEDIVVRRFEFGHGEGVQAALIFVDGMVDKKIISEDILKPLMYETLLFDKRDQSNMSDISKLERTLLTVGDVKTNSDMDFLLDGLFAGDTLLLVDGLHEGVRIDTKGWQNRGVQEPKVEQVVRGPREGFTETIRFNTGLLRRKIQNSEFTIEHMVIGKQTNTNIALAYIKGIVNPKLVKEVKRRLEQINTDAVLESGYIEQFIEDSPFSPFSTIGNSEKPDVVAGRILEGRIAILVDGTPIVLTVPMLFIEGFHASEDYYSRPYYASFIRLLRFSAFAFSLLLPAIVISSCVGRSS